MCSYLLYVVTQLNNLEKYNTDNLELVLQKG